MAKVLFGGGIAEMRRSLEGNTFSRNKGGSYVRQRVRPTNPQTPNQINKREILSNIAKQWGVELTQGQRDAWTNFAEINPRVDVLGQTLQLSGLQMFISLNERLLIASLPTIANPPLNQDVTQITTVTTVFDIGIGDLYSITFSPLLQANEKLQVNSTPQLSPGISFVKNRLRLITASADGTASPFQAKPDWDTKFGTNPPFGAKIVTTVRAINQNNGAISVPLRADTIVIQT